ncbi:MAG TPA: hypothetical protein VIU61_17295 [Kofleriaceae bacterium]
MLDARQQRRFEVARASAAYRRACGEGDLDRSWGTDVARLVAPAVILGGLVLVLSASERRAPVFEAVICSVGWLVLLVETIRRRTGPLVHRLAIVKSTWTSMSGGSAEVMSVGRTLTLVHEDGSESSYLAPNTAAGLVEDGEIGVAITRRRALVRFISLEALASHRA